MIRISARKTLVILEYVLSCTSFTQTEIKEKTNSSIGLVNRIVNWLLDKDFVAKKSKKYELIRPNRLADLIAIQTTVKKERTYELDLSKEKAFSLIKKNKGILCLDSALGIHDKVFASKNKDSEISIYFPDEKLLSALNKTPRGKQKITIYSTDLESEKKHKQKTDELRTILDFYSLNRHADAENLAIRLWGTLQ